MTSGFPPFDQLEARLRAALAEDLGKDGDITSNAIFDPSIQASARVRAKQDGVFVGGPLASMLFQIHDPAVRVEVLASEGDLVARGTEVVRLRGSVRSLLAVERTLLNLLQRLGGIASLTRRFVDAAAGRCAICDTRKTTPLWRDLEKHAVACGGGVNHRMGLHDMAMIKDTHADGAGGLARAIAAVKPLQGRVRIAAEARDLAEVRAALEGGVDLLMLDNMDEATRAQAADLARGRVEIELTGGVSIEAMEALLGCRPDRISIGALTHSAPAMDFSMTLDPEGISPAPRP